MGSYQSHDHGRLAMIRQREWPRKISHMLRTSLEPQPSTSSKGITLLGVDCILGTTQSEVSLTSLAFPLFPAFRAWVIAF